MGFLRSQSNFQAFLFSVTPIFVQICSRSVDSVKIRLSLSLPHPPPNTQELCSSVVEKSDFLWCLREAVYFRHRDCVNTYKRSCCSRKAFGCSWQKDEDIARFVRVEQAQNIVRQEVLNDSRWEHLPFKIPLHESLHSLLIFVQSKHLRPFKFLFQERVSAKQPPSYYLTKLRVYLDPTASKSSKVSSCSVLSFCL